MNYQLGTYKCIKQPNQHGGSFLYSTKKRIQHLLSLLSTFAVLSLTILAIFTAGQWSTPEHITASTITIHDKDQTLYPVMDRIAQCESRSEQFNKDGTVLTNTNKNGTVDVGKYQINMSAEHIKEATKLGYNVMTEQGNRDYAMYIYTHVGTGPWTSSSACWNK